MVTAASCAAVFGLTADRLDVRAFPEKNKQRLRRNERKQHESRNDAMRIWQDNHFSSVSNLLKARYILHTVWCNISGEAAGEIWHWSLFSLGSERVKDPFTMRFEQARRLPLVSVRRTAYCAACLQTRTSPYRWSDTPFSLHGVPGARVARKQHVVVRLMFVSRHHHSKECKGKKSRHAIHPRVVTPEVHLFVV